MRRIGDLFRRIGYLFARGRMDRELREEMEAHRAEMDEPGRFGNTLRLREESREIWGWTWVDEVMGDFRHAYRTIVRMPLVAGVIVVSVGVGIGMNTTVFSWIDAMAIDPIPGVPDDAAIYLIEPRAGDVAYPGASWLEYQDLAERLRSFQSLVAYRMTPFNVGAAERNERTWGLMVSDNYFSDLALEPQLGRFFSSGQSVRAGGGDEVVISNGYWLREFVGDPSALGSTLVVNGRRLRVIGIAPAGFYGTVLGLDFDIWVQASLAPLLFPGSRELESRNQRGYGLIGRLAPGVSASAAQGELEVAMTELGEAHPETNSDVTAEVMPFWQSPRGPQRLLLAGVLLLQVLMLLLLLVVCFNAANLLLARAATRGREIGIRLALGASRWRVARLLMTENLLLAIGGAGLGVGIAVWGTQALRSVPLPTMFPVRLDTAVDAGGLVVAVGLGLASAAAFGLAPALQLVRANRLGPPRSGAATAPASRLRGLFLGAEAAVAVAVLISAGLFLESFRATQTIDPGFEPQGVLLAGYDLSGGGAHLASGDLDENVRISFARRLLEKLRAMPEVEAAAIAVAVPLDIHGLPMSGFAIEGTEVNRSPDRALMNIVTPGYFRTMGIPLLDGSDLADMSARPAAFEIVVNETFVRRYLDGREPVGRRVRTGGADQVIVGVVADSINVAFDEPPMPIIYRSFGSTPLRSGQIHLRTRPGGEILLVPDVRRAVREIEPDLPIYDVRTLGQHVDTNLFLNRIPARMFAVLGPLLLLLVAVGIYAVVAFTVSQRIREIGIRLALGARAGGVVVRIVTETMKVVLIGAVMGWMTVVVSQSHLAPEEGIDPLAFYAVPLLLLAIAALACWLPARRVVRIDPMLSLRDE